MFLGFIENTFCFWHLEIDETVANSIRAQIRAFFAGFGFFANRLYLLAYGRFAKNQTGFEIIEFVQQSELYNGLIDDK